MQQLQRLRAQRLADEGAAAAAGAGVQAGVVGGRRPRDAMEAVAAGDDY